MDTAASRATNELERVATEAAAATNPPRSACNRTGDVQSRPAASHGFASWAAQLWSDKIFRRP